MGVLKGLRKFAGWNAKLGAIAAAPFTGGASLSLLPVANAIGGLNQSRASGLVDTVGSLVGGGRNLPGWRGGRTSGALNALTNVGGVLGRGAQGSAAGRRVDAQIEAEMAARNNQARLDAAKFNLGAPGQRVSQVARGDVLSSMQDAPSLGDPRIDKFGGGGLRPSAFGASSRQAGEELKRQALMSLMSGSDTLTPEISTLPKAGILEKLGSIGGIVGGLAGAAGESGLLKQPVAQMGQVPPLPPEQQGLGGWQAKTQLPGYSTEELEELERRRGGA